MKHCVLLFILFGFRMGEDEAKWYKFQDGEVSEAKLEDDEVPLFRERNASCALVLSRN